MSLKPLQRAEVPERFQWALERWWEGSRCFTNSAEETLHNYKAKTDKKPSFCKLQKYLVAPQILFNWQLKNQTWLVLAARSRSAAQTLFLVVCFSHQLFKRQFLVFHLCHWDHLLMLALIQTLKYKLWIWKLREISGSTWADSCLIVLFLLPDTVMFLLNHEMI